MAGITDMMFSRKSFCNSIWICRERYSKYCIDKIAGREYKKSGVIGPALRTVVWNRAELINNKIFTGESYEKEIRIIIWVNCSFVRRNYECVCGRGE